LQLADWLTSPDHPLTARVMMNRLWMWHFGQPLAKSPSNFGLQSEAPLHQPLLDYLSRRLIDEGWSLKRMHRLIMLSSTYRMSSRSVDHQETDPENEFLWRQNRRRMEVEPLRDSILAAGNSLDRSFDGASQGENTSRRTVYLSINRAALLETFSTFDYVETANHIEQRPVTIVPSQALFLMNHPEVHRQATRLAKEVIACCSSQEERLESLWLHLHGRPPTLQETRLAFQFLLDSQAGQQSQVESIAWASLCRALIAGSQFSHVE
jgi:hypothetical protein